MSKSAPVRVRFSMDRDTWTKVVTFEEDFSIDTETQEHFVIEYASEADYQSALTRLNGKVRYERLTPEPQPG